MPPGTGGGRQRLEKARRPGAPAIPALLVALVATIGCGKRGAPLPPLVRIPAAPADFTVERRGEDVTLQFKVPAANTDGSRPANIERIDVYAFSGPATVNDEQLVKFGMEPSPPQTPEQFAAVIVAEQPRWAKAIRESGAKVD